MHLQRLLQDEERIFSPAAGQGFGDLLFAFAAAMVAQGGQFMRVTLPGHDDPDDGPTGLPGHVAQHLRELHVHLEQGLLHVEDVRGAVTQQGAQGDQIGFGTVMNSPAGRNCAVSESIDSPAHLTCVWGCAAASGR